MKRGQFSVEAVFAANLVVIFFAALFAVNSNLQSEAADRNMLYSSQTMCGDFASVIDAVYASGQGAESEFELNKNVTIYPGMVEFDGGYYCRIEDAAVTGVLTLNAGRYRIRNRGDTIEFS